MKENSVLSKSKLQNCSRMQPDPNSPCDAMQKNRVWLCETCKALHFMYSNLSQSKGQRNLQVKYWYFCFPSKLYSHQ